MMDYESLKKAINSIANKDLEQRKRWYSPAAKAYGATRPGYPAELIRRAVKASGISDSSRILEIGCGPGTATVAFAELGCKIVCLEPNPDFCELAETNCKPYPEVEIINTSFEEWELEPESFDAVLAASSMHWIPSDIGYAKASSALRKDGCLILFWNKEPQPTKPMQDALAEAYERHAPWLGRYEDRATQQEILKGLGQRMLDSGKFQDLKTEIVATSLTYTPDQYVSLLSTYSPYLELDPPTRNTLLTDLMQCILNTESATIELSYLSAYHIAWKATCPAWRPPD